MIFASKACLKASEEPSLLSDKKIETFNGEIPESYRSVGKSRGEGDDILRINFLSEIKRDDNQVYNSEFFFYPSEERTV